MATLTDAIKTKVRHALRLPDLDTIEAIEQDTQTMIEHINQVMEEVRQGMRNREALSKVREVQ